MDLFLIRHAQSQNNALPESERVADPSLTVTGYEQARHLGDWIGSLGLTQLLTSPFLRALETTAQIQRATGLDPDVRLEYHEQGGCYRGYQPHETVGQPGLTRAEIEARFPGYRVADNIDGEGWWKSRPYETHAEAAERASRLFRTTMDEFATSSQRVAVVMHADIQMLFLQHLHGEPVDVPRNASVTRLVLSSDQAVLADYNFVGHLPESLITF